ncbi:hypothetical protein Hanom_Chr04g00296901 [Helianthus anomalus]
MHDMINDLATSVSCDFFLRFDNETKEGISKKTLESTAICHMSFVREDYVAYEKFDRIKSAETLRTFLATSVGVENIWLTFHLSNKILVDLLPELPSLRVLCLSYFQISEVPKSIGTLRPEVS